MQSMREQHDVLLSQLSSRASINHYTHAVVVTVLGSIAWGVGSELNKEGRVNLYLVYAVTLVAILYVLARLVFGLLAGRRERKQFAQLKSLREELELNNPEALLPR